MRIGKLAEHLYDNESGSTSFPKDTTMIALTW